MTLFFIFVSLLVVIALVVILPSALRTTASSELEQIDANIAIARERRKQLNTTFSNGGMDQTEFDAEIKELEQSLAHDLTAAQKHKASHGSSLVVAAIIAVFIPVASGALYLKIGTPKAANTTEYNTQVVQNQESSGTNQPALEELLPNLEKKLSANPEDRNGWMLLGRSYLTVGDFSSAKRALMNAYNIDKNDPDLLAQLAEATAMENNGDLSGKAGEFISSALALNPQHQQSRWLQAIASQQAGKHAIAIEQFEALRAEVKGNADAEASIDELIMQSTQAMGAGVETNVENDNNNDATAGASMSVTVSLSDTAQAAVNANNAVFIFARASSGPPMPLAVARHTVSDLPITVTLDDTMAMMPSMTLSQFDSVTVGARVSQSGNAIAEPGDWFAEEHNVETNAGVQIELIINQQK